MLRAAVEQEVPSQVGILRILGARPVAVVLKVLEQAEAGVVGPVDRLSRQATEFDIEEMPHLAAGAVIAGGAGSRLDIAADIRLQGDRQAPVVKPEVVGCVQTGDPALRRVPIHLATQVGVGQPGDVQVGVVDRLPAQTGLQLGVGGTGGQGGTQGGCKGGNFHQGAAGVHGWLGPVKGWSDLGGGVPLLRRRGRRAKGITRECAAAASPSQTARPAAARPGGARARP